MNNAMPCYECERTAQQRYATSLSASLRKHAALRHTKIVYRAMNHSVSAASTPRRAAMRYIKAARLREER